MWQVRSFSFETVEKFLFVFNLQTILKKDNAQNYVFKVSALQPWPMVWLSKIFVFLLFCQHWRGRRADTFIFLQFFKFMHLFFPRLLVKNIDCKNIIWQITLTLVELTVFRPLKTTEEDPTPFNIFCITIAMVM